MLSSSLGLFGPEAWQWAPGAHCQTPTWVHLETAMKEPLTKREMQRLRLPGLVNQRHGWPGFPFLHLSSYLPAEAAILTGDTRSSELPQITTWAGGFGV